MKFKVHKNGDVSTIAGTVNGTLVSSRRLSFIELNAEGSWNVYEANEEALAAYATLLSKCKVLHVSDTRENGIKWEVAHFEAKM